MKTGMIDFLNCMESFCSRYSVKLFYIVVAFCCAYIIWTAYIHGVYISPDSASYLREAENLYHGYGFNYNGLAGGNEWFSLFPILYPILICIIMKITACNAYLSSKILACVCLVVLAIIIRKNTTKTFLYAPVFLNFGFIWCSLITLSEIPFILFVATTVFLLNRFQSEYDCLIKYAVGILVFCVCAFLTRYFGMFLVFLLSVYCVCNLIRWFHSKTTIHLVKAFYLFAINTVFISVCILYFFLNNRMSGYSSGGKRFVFTENYLDLTFDLLRALLDEVYGLFGNIVHGTLFFLGNHLFFDLITIILFIGIFIHVYLQRNCCKVNMFSSLSKTFFVAGLMYYVVFIVYRYTSTMDHFYYRFFIPGSVLFLIAGINQISLCKVRYVHLIVCTFCFLLIISYAVPGLTYYKGEGYKQTIEKWNQTYSSVKPHSIVLFSYSSMGFHPGLIWHRSDLLFVNEISASSLLDLKREYPQKTVYIDKNYLETIDKTHNINGLILLP